MIELSIYKKLLFSTGELPLQANFNIDKGTFVTLYGKSGAGKTSVLRMLAGLMSPEKGKIIINGTTWFNSDKNINLVPQKRKAGFVFQDFALFPNMNVRENLEFALNKGESQNIINDLIEINELGDLQHRKPDTLSGGQKQRVALARAMVQMPELLLLDEPLSSLDIEIRKKLQQYILKVHREFKLTTILVSHDISEIIKMSDKVLEIDQGKIVKEGIPSKIFTNTEVSGKFQFTGEIIAMEKQDFIFIISILIGKDFVKIIADEDEAKTLHIGDQVIVASKAFNPIIRKIS